MKIRLASAEDTENLGKRLWQALPQHCLVFLHGELGMGKTTLVRGLLRAAGYTGTVKSPTYTLVEPYSIATREIIHADFYRLRDPEELEWMGFSDYLQSDCLCLIEWPEMGCGFLPKADVELMFTPDNIGRVVDINTSIESVKQFLRTLTTF